MFQPFAEQGDNFQAVIAAVLVAVALGVIVAVGRALRGDKGGQGAGRYVTVALLLTLSVVVVLGGAAWMASHFSHG